MKMPIACSLALLLCTPTPAGAVTDRQDGFITQGSLLVNREGKVVKVPLKHTEVRIRVSGYLSEATAIQTFENPYPDKIEAIYVFPLPVNAAVSALELKNGSRVIRGRIMRKARARAVYSRATLAGKVAALLTQQRPNMFTQQVANLEPGKQVEVKLRYTSRLRYDAGAYELVFPMVVGPRFIPRKKGRTGQPEIISPPVLPPDLRSAHDIDLTATIEAGLPIERVRSTSHDVQIKTLSRSRVRVSISATDRIANRDFILRYSVAGPRPRAAVLGHRPDKDAPGSLLLMVQPPEDSSAPRAVPRELVLVLDTSSSMTGAPLDKARELVRRLLTGLGPQDTFQIVRFDDRVSSLGPRMIANNVRNVKLALSWLNRLRASGGTWMSSGISAALTLPHDPARLRLLVLVTDGYIGNEDEILSQVSRQIGPARIFPLGVGTAVNRYLLQEMATLGRGELQVVRPDEPTGEVVERFYRRISRPLLTDLELDFGHLKVTSQIPARLPDLFADQPLFLHAQYQGSGPGTVIVRGRRRGQPVEIRVPVSLPRHQPANRAVALAWARASIAGLQRRLLREDDAAIRARITDLALEHGILCRHTAFVAVDEDSFTAGKAVKVRVSVDRPQYMMRGRSAQGHLSGSAIGSSYGLGGLTLMGSGKGGGGVGHGTIGLGSLGGVGKASGGGGGGYGSGVGYTRGVSPLAGRRAASAPMITAGNVVIRGSLDKEIIRRIIRRHLNEVRYCYQKELQADPKLAGRTVVRFTIDEHGKVVLSEIQSSTLKNAEVETCVAQAVRRWQFPRATGGGINVVSYPFVFKPGPQETKPTTPITPHERR